MKIPKAAIETTMFSRDSSTQCFYSEAQLREALSQQESEIQRLKSLLRTADIKLAQIEAKDMQDNPDDYV